MKVLCSGAPPDQFILPSREHADLVIECTGQTQQAVRTILAHVNSRITR